MKRVIIIALVIISGVSSCRSDYPGFNKILLSIAPHINQGNKDFNLLIDKIPTTESSPYTLEIAIYKFSSGKETLSIDEADTVTSYSDKMKISLLLKITKNDKLIDSKFIEISGDSIENMSIEITRRIKNLQWNF